MNIAVESIYTIKDPELLHDTWVGGGMGTYEENTNWAEGHSIVEHTKGKNERVPVLFASATSIDVLLCALLQDVFVEKTGDHSWRTKYSFEHLTAIPTPHPITELVSLASARRKMHLSLIFLVFFQRWSRSLGAAE